MASAYDRAFNPSTFMDEWKQWNRQQQRKSSGSTSSAPAPRKGTAYDRAYSKNPTPQEIQYTPHRVIAQSPGFFKAALEDMGASTKESNAAIDAIVHGHEAKKAKERIKKENKENLANREGLYTDLKTGKKFEIISQGKHKGSVLGQIVGEGSTLPLGGKIGKAIGGLIGDKKDDSKDVVLRSFDKDVKRTSTISVGDRKALVIPNKDPESYFHRDKKPVSIKELISKFTGKTADRFVPEKTQKDAVRLTPEPVKIMGGIIKKDIDKFGQKALGTLVDAASTGIYGVNSALVEYSQAGQRKAQELKKKNPEEYKRMKAKGQLPQGSSGDLARGFVKGVTWQNKYIGYDVQKELWKARNPGKTPDSTDEIRFAVKGLGSDIVFDPLSYVGIGIFSKAGQISRTSRIFNKTKSLFGKNKLLADSKGEFGSVKKHLNTLLNDMRVPSKNLTGTRFEGMAKGEYLTPEDAVNIVTHNVPKGKFRTQKTKNRAMEQAQSNVDELMGAIKPQGTPGQSTLGARAEHLEKTSNKIQGDLWSTSSETAESAVYSDIMRGITKHFNPTVDTPRLRTEGTVDSIRKSIVNMRRDSRAYGSAGSGRHMRATKQRQSKTPVADRLAADNPHLSRSQAEGMWDQAVNRLKETDPQYAKHAENYRHSVSSRKNLQAKQSKHAKDSTEYKELQRRLDQRESQMKGSADYMADREAQMLHDLSHATAERNLTGRAKYSDPDLADKVQITQAEAAARAQAKGARAPKDIPVESQHAPIDWQKSTTQEILESHPPEEVVRQAQNTLSGLETPLAKQMVPGEVRPGQTLHKLFDELGSGDLASHVNFDSKTGAAFFSKQDMESTLGRSLSKSESEALSAARNQINSNAALKAKETRQAGTYGIPEDLRHLTKAQRDEYITMRSTAESVHELSEDLTGLRAPGASVQPGAGKPNFNSIEDQIRTERKADLNDLEQQFKNGEFENRSEYNRHIEATWNEYHRRMFDAKQARIDFEEASQRMHDILQDEMVLNIAAREVVADRLGVDVRFLGVHLFEIPGSSSIIEAAKTLSSARGMKHMTNLYQSKFKPMSAFGPEYELIAAQLRNNPAEAMGHIAESMIRDFGKASNADMVHSIHRIRAFAHVDPGFPTATELDEKMIETLTTFHRFMNGEGGMIDARDMSKYLTRNRADEAKKIIRDMKSKNPNSLMKISEATERISREAEALGYNMDNLVRYLGSGAGLPRRKSGLYSKKELYKALEGFDEGVVFDIGLWRKKTNNGKKQLSFEDSLDVMGFTGSESLQSRDIAKNFYNLHLSIQQGYAAKAAEQAVSDLQGVRVAKETPLAESLERTGWGRVKGWDENVMFPPESQEVVKRFEEIMNPAKNFEYLKVIDEAIGAWKQVMTTYNLTGYYPRTGVGELIIASLGGVKNPAYYKKATNMVGRGTSDESMYRHIMERPDKLVAYDEVKHLDKSDTIATLKDGTKISVLHAQALYAEAAVPAGFLNVEFGAALSRGKAGKIAERGKLAKAHKRFRLAGEEFENFVRYGHFLHGLENAPSGGGAWGAAKHAGREVRKYHLDYNDVTPFEQAVMARVIPFYKWTRKTAPLMLAMFFQHPGEWNTPQKFLANLSKSKGGDTDGFNPDYGPLVPEWIKGTNTFFMGEDSEGFSTYGGFQFPAMDALGAASTPYATGSLMVSPALKLPYQFLTDRNDFGPNESDDDRLQHLMRQSPQTKYLHKLFTRNRSPLIQEDGKINEAALQFFTGSAIYEAPPEYKQYDSVEEYYADNPDKKTPGYKAYEYWEKHGFPQNETLGQYMDRVGIPRNYYSDAFWQKQRRYEEWRRSPEGIRYYARKNKK